MDSINSILNQSLHEIELICIDDGSTDTTREILESIKDKRLSVVVNNKNIGLIETLNKGIKLCRGQYIARMDADDICHKDRLLCQYRFMEKNPEYVACGTNSLKIKDGRRVSPKLSSYRAFDHKKLMARMLKNPPISHPSAMIRSSTIKKNGIFYKKDYKHCEDYKLWLDLSKTGKLYVIGRPLLEYRIHSNQVSTVFSKLQEENSNKVREQCIKHLIPDISPHELKAHIALMTQNTEKVNGDRNSIVCWSKNLVSRLMGEPTIDPYELKKIVKKCLRGN